MYVNTLNLTSTAVNQTVTQGEGYYLVERVIGTFSGLEVKKITIDGVALDPDNDFSEYEDYDLSASDYDKGLYKLTQKDGKTVLSYVMEGTAPVTPSTPGTDNIPEPATATLSLLALGGLAARRRRK